MSALIDAYDSYLDFEREAYFVITFQQVPSQFFMELPLESSKENMDAVLAALDLTAHPLEVVFKKWNTEDHKDAEFSKDYPYQYLLKSPSEALLIFLDLNSEELEINFLYDATNTNLEKRVAALLHHLRQRFGEEGKPLFHVLSRNQRYFYTKEVRTEKHRSDIPKLYNTDFQEIHATIERAFSAQKAGLILLHGLPGTGKTSYIKHLITQFKDKRFIFIQNEFVQELLHPDFISFLLKHSNSVLIIEDAEKVLMSREQQSANSVVSTILQLTDGLFSDYLNIKIICTFNCSISKIDQALLRKGRMLAYYEFKALAPEKADALLLAKGYTPQGQAMTLADIFNYEHKAFEEGEKKKIGF